MSSKLRRRLSLESLETRDTPSSLSVYSTVTPPPISPPAATAPVDSGGNPLPPVGGGGTVVVAPPPPPSPIPVPHGPSSPITFAMDVYV